jgi:hypothetical protein
LEAVFLPQKGEVSSEFEFENKIFEVENKRGFEVVFGVARWQV